MYVIPPNYILHRGGGLMVGRRVGVSHCSKIVLTKKTYGGTVTHGRIQRWGDMVKKCCTRVTCEILTNFGFC